MYRVLNKDNKERSQKEIKEMTKLIKEIPYFKERKMEEMALIEVFKVMKLMTIPADKNVLEYGDIGENFYFIMHGKVDILIPDYNKIDAFKEARRELHHLREERQAVHRTYAQLE